MRYLGVRSACCVWWSDAQDMGNSLDHIWSFEDRVVEVTGCDTCAEEDAGAADRRGVKPKVGTVCCIFDFPSRCERPVDVSYVADVDGATKGASCITQRGLGDESLTSDSHTDAFHLFEEGR